MQKNTKILIAAFGVLGLMLSQQSEAKTAKEVFSSLFSKIKTGISKANTVLTTIEGESNTAANDSTYGKVQGVVSTANSVLDKASTVVNNVQSASGSGLTSIIQGVAAGMGGSSSNGVSTMPTPQQLQADHENLEVLRQKAQTSGASIQDKVNYLNAYSAFKTRCSTYLTNRNAELQTKAAEYETLKSEYEATYKLSTSADSAYAASQSATGGSTPVQQTLAVPQVQSPQLPTQQ